MPPFLGLFCVPYVASGQPADPSATQCIWSTKFGNVWPRAPFVNAGPTPPPPDEPWQLAQLLKILAPAANGPAAAFGGVSSVFAYTKAHNGSARRAGMAQNGIFFRCLYAWMYGGSGFGGGGGAGATAGAGTDAA